jgi:NAD(P)-dependent dehydrogenase (short-subunit alcohol dehydrogenase family)
VPERKATVETRLDGKNFIVTGGTQGLGETVARLFAENGAAGIAICGRNRERGVAVAADIEALGSKCLYVPADLQREEDCRRVASEAIDRFGTIHGLVNAAGVTDRGTIDSTTVDLWNFVMNVNARAPFILMQETIRNMREKQVRGSIVNMISDNCHGGHTFLTAYAASKGALATMTKNVAHSVLEDRIRVNGICLGWTATPHEHEIQVAEGQPENWLEIAEKSKPFGRLLRPEDIASLALYLVSDLSVMMTGALIDYDQKVIGGLD